jgi:hypothetical protein
VQVLLLPQQVSVACQVWVTIIEQPLPLVTLLISDTDTFAQHGSVAVGAAGNGSVQLKDWLLHPTKLGATGITITVCEQVSVLPEQSITCQTP